CGLQVFYIGVATLTQVARVDGTAAATFCWPPATIYENKGGWEERAMIEVTVYDVLLHVPKGAEVQWPRDAAQLGRMPLRMALVILKECQGERLLPIWVGIPDAIAIAQPLAEVTPPRPMTHDLIARLVEVSASRVVKVAVTKLYDRTFYATLWVHVGEGVHEVDARPSDALSLALRMRIPI